MWFSVYCCPFPQLFITCQRCRDSCSQPLTSAIALGSALWSRHLGFTQSGSQSTRQKQVTVSPATSRGMCTSTCDRQPGVQRIRITTSLPRNLPTWPLFCAHMEIQVIPFKCKSKLPSVLRGWASNSTGCPGRLCGASILGGTRNPPDTSLSAQPQLTLHWAEGFHWTISRGAFPWLTNHTTKLQMWGSAWFRGLAVRENALEFLRTEFLLETWGKQEPHASPN